MKWYALDVTCEAGAREAVEYALMEACALGTESSVGVEGSEVSNEVVTAYFDSPPEVERVRAALMDALRVYGLASGCVRELKIREVEGRDWLAEWKKGWRPVV